MPLAVVGVHLALLAGIVVFAHHPVVFLGLLLLFLGFAQAYDRYQDSLILKEALLVGFFLAGLVVLGGMQRWWLQPIVSGLEPLALFFGGLALTAVTDNAALTYLGSLVSDISEASKYMLVAGAVAGGGLTVIANAPNPAGVTLLKQGFADGQRQRPRAPWLARCCRHQSRPRHSCFSDRPSFVAAEGAPRPVGSQPRADALTAPEPVRAKLCPWSREPKRFAEACTLPAYALPRLPDLPPVRLSP